MSDSPLQVVPTVQGRTHHWYEPSSLDQAIAFAERLSQSGLVPKELRGKPADIIVVLSYARSIGVDAAQALHSVYVVEGRPTLSSDLCVALVRRSGLCRDWQEKECSPTCVTIETTRADDGSVWRRTWTIERAGDEGLLRRKGKKGWYEPVTWKKHPQQMLRARCAGELARAAYPDVLAGVYVHGELDSDDSTPEPQQATEVRVVQAELVESAPAVNDDDPAVDDVEEAAEVAADRARFQAAARNALGKLVSAWAGYDDETLKAILWRHVQDQVKARLQVASNTEPYPTEDDVESALDATQAELEEQEGEDPAQR